MVIGKLSNLGAFAVSHPNIVGLNVCDMFSRRAHLDQLFDLVWRMRDLAYCIVWRADTKIASNLKDIDILIVLDQCVFKCGIKVIEAT